MCTTTIDVPIVEDTATARALSFAGLVVADFTFIRSRTSFADVPELADLALWGIRFTPVAGCALPFVGTDREIAADIRRYEIAHPGRLRELIATVVGKG